MSKITGKYTFNGYWDAQDIKDCDGEPWEKWRMVLHGTEAGDAVYIEPECGNTIDTVCELAGVRILLVDADKAAAHEAGPELLKALESALQRLNLKDYSYDLTVLTAKADLSDAIAKAKART